MSAPRPDSWPALERSRSKRRWLALGKQLAVALAYIAGGFVSVAAGLISRGPDGQASVVWLPPGIALAAMLIFGRRYWPGVLLGAAAVDALISRAESPHAELSVLLAMTLVCAVGSALQALVAARLVKRFAGPSVVLDTTRSVSAYLGSVLLASLITPSAGSLGAVVLHVRSAEHLLFDWFSWWVSDTASALLVTPVVLAWLARPAELWRPRRWRLGLPLGAALVIVSTLFVQANRLEGDRTRRELAGRVEQASDALAHELDAISVGTQDAADFVGAEVELRRARFIDLSRTLRRREPGLAALAWVPRVTAAERADYEQRRRLQRVATPLIYDVGPGGAQLSAPSRPLYFPIDSIDAEMDVRGLVGVDLGALPERRALLEAAELGNGPTFSPPMTFLSTRHPGFLVAVPVRSYVAGPDSYRSRGFVVAGVRLEPFMARAYSGELKADLDIRLWGVDAEGGKRPWFQSGAWSPSSRAAQYAVTRELRAGNNHFLLELRPTATFLRRLRLRAGTAVSLLGVLLSSLLCGLLLIATGQAANVAREVALRTRELSQANQRLLEEIESNRRTQQALAESELRWQFALEEASEGVWDWDVPRGQLYWSPRLLRVLGYEPGELDASLEKWAARMHPDDLEKTQADLERHLRGETSAFDAEVRMRHKDGSWVWFKTRAKVVARDATGQPLRVIGTQTDIGQGKQLEQELTAHQERLEEEVLARTEELQIAKVAAEEANRAKSLFLANMSHELRTPLHAVLGYARLALERAPEARLRGFLEQILGGGERLLLLLNDLLDLSKLEAGKMGVQCAPRDLEQLAREATVQLEPLLARKRLRVDFERTKSCQSCIAEVDATRMTQVFHNVLANAVRFSPEGGGIVVRFAPGSLPGPDGARRPALEVSFSDQGLGIPEEDLERIFDAFTQSSRTRSSAGGTGLGLAICRQLVALHRGEMLARNNRTGGATFTLTLPLQQADWSQAA